MKWLYIIILSFGFTLVSAAEINKIVIDPGHGGEDFGCHGIFAHEKDINLAVSLKLGELINKYLPEVSVLYTRKEDKTLNLCDRAIAANTVKADLFISIHCNAAASSSNTSARGVEVYIQNINLSQEELKRAKASTNNEYEEIESYNCPSNDFSSNKMILAASVAVKVVRNMGKLGFHTKGVKKANFMVLRKTKMPSILIEIGFLTNPDEETFLASDRGQLMVATSILKSIIDLK